MIDINKKYKYIHGGMARILCTDAKGKFPIVTINEDGMVVRHNSDGLSDMILNNSYDLEEFKEKKELWINVYRYDGDYYGNAWSTKQDCKDEDQRLKEKEGTLVSRVKMEFEEGQFDE